MMPSGFTDWNTSGEIVVSVFFAHSVIVNLFW